MADTKRGRERSGLGKERQRRLEEIEHDLANWVNDHTLMRSEKTLLI